MKFRKDFTPKEYEEYLEQQAQKPDKYCSAQDPSHRKLASIQVVSKLIPIPNADKIEMAKILGWECVVEKGQFKEGGGRGSRCQ